MPIFDGRSHTRDSARKLVPNIADNGLPRPRAAAYRLLVVDSIRYHRMVTREGRRHYVIDGFSSAFGETCAS